MHATNFPRSHSRASAGANERAIACAKELVDRLGIQAPEDLDIELIAAYHDVFVTYRPLHDHEGHLLRGPDVGLVVVDTGALESCKWRFVIAHELGHYLLHEEIDQFHLCSNADAHPWYKTNGSEREANTFASQLLMPDRLFLPLMEEVEDDPSIDNLSELAHRFRMSLTATALKFLRITQRACALVYSRRGRIEWCSVSPQFLPKLRPHTMLGRNTYAAALWRGEDIPNAPLPNEVSAWSGTLKAARKSLFEHSIRSDQYDSVLTWLTHD